MKIIKYSSLALILLTSVVFRVTLAESLPPKNQIKLAGHLVRSDRVIVRFKNNQQRASTVTQQASLFSKLGVKKKETIRFNKRITSTRATNQELVFTILSLDGSKGLKTVLKQLNGHPSILYAEPDYIRHKSALPNDPEFPQLWGLNNSGQDGGLIDADIDAPEAWDTTTDSGDTVIGVIDSGVDYTHEDLAANMWVNPGEIPGDGIDNDGNGYVDDIHGIDCANDDSDPMDDNGHGTHVTGTIGAVGDNGIGVAGVNWNTKIMALKYLNAGGGGPDSDAIECLAYAVNMKKNHGIDIRITNNSWGGRVFGQALKDAIQASANANMLFIAAAGNDFNDIDFNREYPAGFNIDNIISVAATDRDDRLWSDPFGGSNTGAITVDLGAPGHDILSTTPGNQYELNSGTSMATPHVVGAAALLWSNNPSLAALEVKYRLMDQGDPVAELEGQTVSGRRLNVNSALNCIPGSPVLSILTPKNQFDLLTGDVLVKARITDCGVSVTNKDVLAVPGNGDASFTLFDDGQGADNTADDGIYTGIWQLQNPGKSFTLSINADTLGLSTSVTGVALNNIPYKLDAAHPYDWIDATLGIRLGISDYDDTEDLDFFESLNDSSETIVIGFDFEFYGISYSELDVDSNGILIFGNNHSFFNHPHAPIPLNAHPNGFIAPYWADINPGKSQTSNIYSLLEGTAPNRRLTIAWVETPLSDETSSDSPLTFEVTLYEGSNDIIFQYPRTYQADSATIGIEHTSGNYGLQYLHNGENKGLPIQIHEEQAIRFFIEDDTPPDTVAPSIPTGLTLNSATATAVSFSWTPSTDDQGTVALYHIMRDGIEIGTSPVASFTDNTVTADTAYVYTVTAEDDSGNESEASADLNVETSIPSGPELLAGYAFEEGSGQTILDLSGNGNNGRLQGNASRNPTDKIGEAIEFKGSNSYINLGSIDISSPTLSIALWFKADDFGTHDARLISKATGTARSAHYWMVSTIRSSGQHKLRFRLKTDNGGTSTLIGNAALTAGDWIHVTATYDGVAMKLFQNGVEVGSLAKTGTIATSAAVDTWIGANPSNNRYFDGLIDDVRIYGEALDLTTIQDIMQGNLPLINDDNEAPSIPTGLTLNSATATSVSFSWMPSTDDFGNVALYHIMRDTIEIDTSSVASYTDITVAADTAYVYNVTAEDDSGNESAASADLIVETLVPSGPELIAGYPFEEGSGQTVLDLSGNGNNGTLQGNVTRNPAGKVGEAIEFNGSNSHINLGSIDISSPTLSIALWFKADDFGTHDARLISKATGTARSAHYWMVSTIRRSGQHKLRFRLKTSNGGTSTLIGSTALIPGVWTHVTAIYDGSEMKLIQDGVQVGSRAKSGTISTSAAIETWIGANPGNTRYFDGLIDDVRIYGEALDLTTIDDIIQGNLPLNSL